MLVKKELLTQDFEGIMKYFRVNIPKKLRSEDHAKYGLQCQWPADQSSNQYFLFADN